MTDEEKSEIIKNTEKLCSDLKTGRFIMSQDRISQILKYIASENELMRVISHANNDFYFDDELEKATDVLGEGGKILRLPTGASAIVALVTGLLYKFDRRALNFHDFISGFYPSLTANDEFSRFCDAVIEPYKIALTELVKKDANEPIVIERALEINPLSESALSEILQVLESITEEIIDIKVRRSKNKEYFAVLEGMYYAVESGDERMVRAMFIGLKYTLSDVKIIRPYLRNLENLLGMYFSLED